MFELNLSKTMLVYCIKCCKLNCGKLKRRSSKLVNCYYFISFSGVDPGFEYWIQQPSREIYTATLGGHLF